MLNEKIKKMINEQINKEFFSSYLYLAFSCYYTSKNLNGFANWYNVQAQEEKDHAMLFLNYMLNNSEEVELEALEKPEGRYADLEAPLLAGFKHEQFITASINDIYAEALGQKDFRTVQFLDWFVKEQGEEEKNADELIQNYRLFGKDGKGLFMMDRELAARVYTATTIDMI